MKSRRLKLLQNMQEFQSNCNFSSNIQRLFYTNERNKIFIIKKLPLFLALLQEYKFHDWRMRMGKSCKDGKKIMAGARVTSRTLPYIVCWRKSGFLFCSRDTGGEARGVRNRWPAVCRRKINKIIHVPPR